MDANANLKRRLEAQRQAVRRLARELAFEIAVLRRLEGRSRRAAPGPSPALDLRDVYLAALRRAAASEAADSNV